MFLVSSDTGSGELQNVSHNTNHGLNKYKRSFKEFVSVVVYVSDNLFIKKENNELKRLEYYCKVLLKNKRLSVGLCYYCGDSKLAAKAGIKSIRVTALSGKNSCRLSKSSAVHIDGIQKHDREDHERFETADITWSRSELLENYMQLLSDDVGVSTSLAVCGPGFNKAYLEDVVRNGSYRTVTLDAANMNSASFKSVYKFHLRQAMQISRQQQCILYIHGLQKATINSKSILGGIQDALDFDFKSLGFRLTFVIARKCDDMTIRCLSKVYVGRPIREDRVECLKGMLTSTGRSEDRDVETVSAELAGSMGGHGRGSMSSCIKRSNAKRFMNKDVMFTKEDDDSSLNVTTNIRDEDVSKFVGNDELLDKLRKVVMCQTTNSRSQKRIMPPYGGLLLHGKAGCGKTSIVRMLAHESKMNLFVVDPQIYDPYLGGSERNIAEVFLKAKANAPSIVFMDEIDLLIGNRSSEDENSVENRVAIALLLSMDQAGCSEHNLRVPPEERVMVIAATNNLDRNDASVLRRFGKLYEVKPPNRSARLEILKHYISKHSPQSNVNLDKIAESTDGCSGADLENICKQAFELKYMTGEEGAIEDRHLEEALNELISPDDS